MRGILCLLALCASPSFAQQPSLTRLDGSRISPAEIDAAVAKSIQAAKVTGAGIAILHRGKIV